MEEVLSVFVGMFIFALIVILIMAIVSYVVDGLFLTKIAKDNYIQNKWMAWVPVLQEFYIGYAAGVMTYDMNFSYTYIGGTIASLILMAVGQYMELSIISAIGIIFVYVLSIIAIYKIFKTYFLESAIWLTILAFLFPIALFIIKIIIITKKDFLPTKIEE